METATTVGEFGVGASVEGDREASLEILKLLNVPDLGVSEDQAIVHLNNVLRGRSFAELLSLPQELENEEKRLLEDTHALVYDNYKTFLDLAINLSKTRKAIHETRILQSALQDDVKLLESRCSDFGNRSASVAEQRRVSRLMMQHYSRVMEVLEVPQLIEACVKSRQFDRALDLMQKARCALVPHLHAAQSSSRNLNTSLPSQSDGAPQHQQRMVILDGVSHEVERAARQMREVLLVQLQSDCDMQTAIQTVDWLRRLETATTGATDEIALRRRFLSMREQWMETGRISASDGRSWSAQSLLHEEGGSQWACKVIVGQAERLRVDLFMVVTQYQTLFSGDVPGAEHLLWSFAFRKVGEFLDMLKSHIPALQDGEEIGTAVEHVMYCGTSLSRVGLDFRPLVAPCFEQTVKNMFSRKCRAAQFFFSESLRTHDWRLDGSADTTPVPMEDQSSSLHPPLSLLRHPPLASLANEMIDACNHLRYCSFVSLTEFVRATVRSTMLNASQTLKAWGYIPSDSKVRPVYNDMLKEFVDSLEPFVDAMVRALLAKPLAPPTQGTEQ